MSYYNHATLFDGFEGFQIIEPIRSPLNYIGGKYKLLPQILAYFPKNINTFVDLFCGGCNVGINVNAKRILFNDNLIFLIELYQALRTMSLDSVLEHIYSQISTFELSLTNSEGYRKLRSLYNSEKNPLDLFVLIAFSFNHQIRFNSAHQFNNPFGKDRNCFNPTMENNLIQFVDRLHQIDCTFSASDFRNFTFDQLTQEDFVYCDPPYLITTGTYNDGKRGFTGWGINEEKQLLSILNTLNNRGVKFALSNVLTHKGRINDLLIEWINNNGYHIVHLDKNYANSNYHTSDRRLDASDEVLIFNFDVQ